MASNYKQFSADTQVKVGAGKLKGIFVTAASSTPTITVYDSGASSTSDPKILDVFTPVAGTMYQFTGDDGGVYFNKGLFIDIANAVSATVFYE